MDLSISAKQPSSTEKHKSSSLLTPTVKRWLWETEQKEYGSTHIHLAPFEAVTL